MKDIELNKITGGQTINGTIRNALSRASTSNVLFVSAVRRNSSEDFKANLLTSFLNSAL